MNLKTFSRLSARRRLSLPLLAVGVGALVAGSVQVATAASGTPGTQTPAIVGRAEVAKSECVRSAECDLTGLQKRIDSFAPSLPIPSGAKWPSQNQVVAAAQSVASKQYSDKSKLPTQDEELTYGAFLAKFGQAPDPLVDLSRPIWVITVHGHRDDLRNSDGVIGNNSVYTEVVDAGTGALISEGINLDAFAG